MNKQREIVKQICEKFDEWVMFGENSCDNLYKAVKDNKVLRSFKYDKDEDNLIIGDEAFALDENMFEVDKKKVREYVLKFVKKYEKKLDNEIEGSSYNEDDIYDIVQVAEVCLNKEMDSKRAREVYACFKLTGKATKSLKAFEKKYTN